MASSGKENVLGFQRGRSNSMKSSLTRRSVASCAVPSNKQISDQRRSIPRLMTTSNSGSSITGGKFDWCILFSRGRGLGKRMRKQRNQTETAA